MKQLMSRVLTLLLGRLVIVVLPFTFYDDNVPVLEPFFMPKIFTQLRENFLQFNVWEIPGAKNLWYFK